MSNIFEKTGLISNNTVSLSAKQVIEHLNSEVILVDVREEFMTHIKIFDVQNQINIPITKLLKTTEVLPKNKALIFADATGVKSKAAFDIAKKNGIENIAILAGGIVEWERQGLPTTTFQKLKVMGKNKCEFVDKNYIDKPEP